MTQPVESGSWNDTIFFVCRSPLDKDSWYPSYVDATADFVSHCGSKRRVQTYAQSFALNELGGDTTICRWETRTPNVSVLRIFQPTVPVPAPPAAPDYTQPVPLEPEGPDTTVEVTPTQVDQAPSGPDAPVIEVVETPKHKHSKWTAWMWADSNTH